MSASPLRQVLHGEDELQRSRYEQTLLTKAQEQGKDIVTIDLNSISAGEFTELLGTTSLFGVARLLRINNLEKIRSNKTLNTSLEQVLNAADDVLIIIQGKLTPAKKKLFTKPWQVREFSLPAVLFEFLEAMKTRPIHETFALYRQALENGSEWGLHSLVARQFRLLLAAKTGAKVAAPPFAQNKLRSQANKFTVAELTQNLHTLYDIERAIKSGSTPLSWSQQFDILLTRLYQQP